jgi:acyl carrier protein
MSVDYNYVHRFLIATLNEVNICEKDYVSLAEKLDSLDRLEVISACEDAFQVDLTAVLVEPECWVSLDSLTKAIKNIFLVNDE